MHNTNLKHNPSYQDMRALFACTNLRGPHIDFYTNPFSPGKSTPEENLAVFRRQMDRAIATLSRLSDGNLSLDSHVIRAMIELNDTILSTDSKYWKFYSYDDRMIVSIRSTYQTMADFLHRYLGKSRGIKNADYEKIYLLRLEYCLTFRVDPRALQDYAIGEINAIKSAIEKTGQTIRQAMIDEKNGLIACTSESDLIARSMRHTIRLHDAAKNVFSPDVSIPDPNIIKIKIDTRNKGSPEGTTVGRKLLLADLNYYSVNTLERLIARYVIPGHIFYKANLTRVSKQYADDREMQRIIIKSSKILSEGLACYGERILVPSDTTQYYLDRYYQMIRIILDTGLNGLNVRIRFTYDEAKLFLADHTMSGNHRAESEIMRCLTQPGVLCCGGLGYSVIKLMETMYLAKGYCIKDFYSFIYSTPLPVELLLEMIDETVNRRVA